MTDTVEKVFKEYKSGHSRPYDRAKEIALYYIGLFQQKETQNKNLQDQFDEATTLLGESNKEICRLQSELKHRKDLIADLGVKMSELQFDNIRLREAVDKELEKMKTEYRRGFLNSMECFAHWKDGIEYVGTSGKTLEQAAQELESNPYYSPLTSPPSPTEQEEK